MAAEIPERLQKVLGEGRDNPVLFIEELLGMKLHEGQKRYIRESYGRKNRINLLTCANRWGKSTVIACLHIHHLFYKIGVPKPVDDKSFKSWEDAEYRTANIAPHSALTEPVFKTITQIMTSTFPVRQDDGTMKSNECLIGWFYLPDKQINTPPYKQFFHNNSYIEHRSLGADQGDALQGKPFGLITYDEGFRSDHLQNEVDDAILPRLADYRAQLHILSTPSQASKSSLYAYHLYENGRLGRNSTYTQTGSLRENTFFDEGIIQAQYDMFADNPLKEQVLEGKFLFGGDTLFPYQDIEYALDQTLDNGVDKRYGHKYVIGVDTAIGKDEFVITVLDSTKKPFQLVHMDGAKGNSRSPQLHLVTMCNIVDKYLDEGNVQVLIETWNGESARFYQDLPPYIKAITSCYGAWQPVRQRTDNANPIQNKTKNIKKADLLVALKKILAARSLRIPKNNLKLLEQLQIYREDDKNLDTDRVISLALATWLADDMTKVTVPVWTTVEF